MIPHSHSLNIVYKKKTPFSQRQSLHEGITGRHVKNSKGLVVVAVVALNNKLFLTIGTVLLVNLKESGQQGCSL